MKKQFTILAAAICCVLTFSAVDSRAQCGVSVTHVAGADIIATAKGSATGGVPAFTYTAGAGASRAIIFVLSFERDHTSSAGCSSTSWGKNFASAGLDSSQATQNPKITLSWGGIQKNWAAWRESSGSKTAVDPLTAELSIEQYVFIFFEGDIPAGGGSLVVGGDFVSPKNAGDEASFSASTFINVNSWEFINGTSTYPPTSALTAPSISTNMASSSQPTNTSAANNMIVTPILFSKEGGTITASPGTIIADSSVSNTVGTYIANKCSLAAYTENDGIHSAILLTTGTGSVTINSSITAPAPALNGMMAFRLMPASCILPVTLTNFSAQKNGNGVVLNWATASEQNNRGFDVQRSTDGVNWATIGNVASQAANGNSSSTLSYTYTDNQPLGGTDYYRLNQVDLDGRSTFSSTQTVVFGTASAQVVVSPNPAPNATTVSGIAVGNTVRLVDMAGRVINTQTATGNTATIQLYNYPAGVYLVQVLNNGTVTTTVKLVKQ